ncbi:MAG: YeaH/YhbH family protein [Gammaproteobacteria bacterium]|nr:YeaH/YhbH family protein [Gammaproteobacteria bacterium]
MSFLIDRRLNGKGRSEVNRQRFLDRYRRYVKQAVAKSVSERSITDTDGGTSVSIPKKNLEEPSFGHGQGGNVEHVLPGNREFAVGDKIERPRGGGPGRGSGDGEASQDGEGEDDFVFRISSAEYLQYLFEELELPNLTRRHLGSTEVFDRHHGGITTVGNPAQLHLVRTMRSAYGRRLALSAARKRNIESLEQELDQCSDEAQRAELEARLARKRAARKVAYLDDMDLRYNFQTLTPRPICKAVMFCIMDVSGSMDQHCKDTAKRFYLLLHLFLKRHYEKIDVVFIRHHSTAKEVDEHTFFTSRETGGTVVSSALTLTTEIAEQRYGDGQWNIYCAQASDGDNWLGDSARCAQLLQEQLLPLCQYYSYIEIGDRDPQQLWFDFEALQSAHSDRFAMRRVKGPSDIFPVFCDLFRKQEAA